MTRKGGKFDEQRIVPKAAVDDMRGSGDRAAFAKAGYKLLEGWSCRNTWWITQNEHGAFGARGVHSRRAKKQEPARGPVHQLKSICEGDMAGTPKGIRTPAAGLKGPCPRPG